MILRQRHDPREVLHGGEDIGPEPERPHPGRRARHRRTAPAVQTAHFSTKTLEILGQTDNHRPVEDIQLRNRTQKDVVHTGTCRSDT